MNRNDPDDIGGRSRYRHPTENAEIARRDAEAAARRAERDRLHESVGRRLDERLARRGVRTPDGR